MEYTKLKDRVKKRFLPEFLSVLRNAHGNCVTIAINRELVLFENKVPHPNSDPELLQALARLPLNTKHHMATIGFLVATLGSGLSREQQSLLWLSDNDEIVSNPQRQADANDICGNLLNLFLRHDLHAWGLVKPDDMKGEELMSEDLLSVADLFAGALCDMLSNPYVEQISLPQGNLYRATMPEKAANILSTSELFESESFRSFHCRLDSDGNALVLSPLFFNFRLTV